jgi:sarcosine oxidase
MRGKPPTRTRCGADRRSSRRSPTGRASGSRAPTRAGRAQSCFYTTTDDEGFILERHGPIVVGSACSGHGFKFGPAVGNRLAALALEALA